jgi:hypothetical protein
VAGVITAPEPSWIAPFTGLSPRQFAKLVTALRREGADPVRRGWPWSLPLVAVSIRAFPGLSAHLYVLHSLRGAVMAFGSTLHFPQLPSRLPSTHPPWSGRGSWRPSGARHCTNDLDAMGRVCPASPGSTVDGMGAPHAHRYGPAAGSGAPLHPGAGRSPAGGTDLPGAQRSPVLDSWPPALSTCGRASAQRARSGPKAGAQPGALNPLRRLLLSSCCDAPQGRVLLFWTAVE